MDRFLVMWVDTVAMADSEFIGMGDEARSHDAQRERAFETEAAAKAWAEDNAAMDQLGAPVLLSQLSNKGGWKTIKSEHWFRGKWQ